MQAVEDASLNLDTLPLSAKASRSLDTNANGYNITSYINCVLEWLIGDQLA